MNRVLKTTKNPSVNAKHKNMRTFRVKLLFIAVTEGYSNNRAANNNTNTILTPLN